MKLSVVTINLNNKDGLLNTLNSLFVNQDFTDYESIVIDGKSTDGSLGVIESFDNRISYWVSETDSGIYNAMNKGIRKAKGDYLLFLNSGDCLVKGVLSEIFSKQLPVYDFIYGNCIQVYPNGEKKEVYMPSSLSLFDLYKGSLIHSATFIRRNLFNDYLYSETYKIVSDWEFFLKKIIIENATCCHLNLFISKFDMTGVSSQESFRKLQIRERKDVLSKCFSDRILVDYETFSLAEDIKNNDLLLKLVSLPISRTFRLFLMKLIVQMSKVYLFIKKY